MGFFDFLRSKTDAERKILELFESNHIDVDGKSNGFDFSGVDFTRALSGTEWHKKRGTHSWRDYSRLELDFSPDLREWPRGSDLNLMQYERSFAIARTKDAREWRRKLGSYKVIVLSPTLTIDWVNDDLSDTNFEGFDFSENARSCETVRDGVIDRGPVFDFEKCNFGGANFSRVGFGELKFQDCNFIESKFVLSDLDHVNFINCDLTGADFSNTKFDSQLLPIDADRYPFADESHQYSGGIFFSSAWAAKSGYGEYANKFFRGINKKEWEKIRKFSDDLTDTERHGPRFIDCDLTGVKINGSDWFGCDFSSLNISRFEAKGSELSLANFSKMALESCDFSLSYFRYADFSGADFKGCNLTGTYLDGIDLRRAKNLNQANFTEALFGPETDLSRKNFQGSDLRNAVFDRTKVHTTNFTETNLSGAKFNSDRVQIVSPKLQSIRKCSFEEATLAYASFSYPVIAASSFRNANLDHAKFIGINEPLEERDSFRINSWYLEHSARDELGKMATRNDFSGASMDGTFLDGIFIEDDFSNIDLSNLKFEEKDIHPNGLIFIHCRMAGIRLPPDSPLPEFITCDFSDSNCEGVDFTNNPHMRFNLRHQDKESYLRKFPSMRYSLFVGADLSEAKFSGLDLTGCDFSRAVINGADFKGAILRDTNFSDTEASGADFTEADLSGSNLDLTDTNT